MTVLIPPLAALLANCAAQIATCRAKLGLLRSIKTGFAAGLAALALLHERNGFGLDTAAANVIIYITLSYCYFHFLNLGETARRIRLLRELADRPAGMTAEELAAAYNAKEMVEKRLARILSSGQASECADGKIRAAGGQLTAMALAVTLAKKAFLGKERADLPQARP